MKKIAMYMAVLGLAASANAAPLVTIGDEVDVFFKGAVIGKWDSNVYLGTGAASSPKVDDYILTVRLGAELDYGKNSKVKANIKFFEDINRYSNLSHLNNELANVIAKVSYVDERYRGDADFSYSQLQQNNSTMLGAGGNPGDQVRYDTYNAGLMNTYLFTDKITGELSIRYYRQHFLEYSDIYSDNNCISVPLNILYQVTEKINAGLSYQYRRTTFSGGDPWSAMYGDARDDHFIGVNVRGEIFEKLTGSLYFGATHRQLDNAVIADNSSDWNFTMNANLAYQATEKLVATLDFYRDYNSGASRQNIVNTGVVLGSRYAITEFVSANASLRYENSKYESYGDRTDDEYSLSMGLTYTPCKYITVGANYSYYMNSSSVAAATYNRHLVSLDVSVKY